MSSSPLVSTEKYINFLCDICNMETPTAEKSRIDKMVDYIESFAKNEGYCVERIPFEKAGDCLLITLAGDNTKSPALLMAHMDTVHPVGLFGEGDFIKIKDDIIYGPGVQDCKGGIATALYCLERLKHEENLRPVKLLLTSDDTMRELFRVRSKDYTRGLMTNKRMFESFIPYFEIEDNKLTRLELLPIELEFDAPRWRNGNPRIKTNLGIIERLNKMSKEFGTKISINKQGIGIVEL